MFKTLTRAERNELTIRLARGSIRLGSEAQLLCAPTVVLDGYGLPADAALWWAYASAEAAELAREVLAVRELTGTGWPA